MSTKPKKNIPWEVVLPDGSTSTNYDDVMSRWKHDFELLLNYQNDQTIELCDLPELPVNLLDTSSLDTTITRYYNFVYYTYLIHRMLTLIY